jgi:hypothetical protein
MKYIVIILLLSTSGVERIELKTNSLWLKIPEAIVRCGEITEKWREINTTYYESRNTDPNSPKEQQGNYTRDGRLMIGYLCQ